MQAFTTFLSYFLLAFAGLAVVGFLVGANGNYETSLDELVVREMSLLIHDDRPLLLYQCDGAPEAQYDPTTRAVSSNFSGRVTKSEVFVPGQHKEFILAVLGGGSAGMTVKYFAGLRNSRSGLAGVILGTISGYMVGTYAGERFALTFPTYSSGLCSCGFLVHPP